MFKGKIMSAIGILLLLTTLIVPSLNQENLWKICGKMNYHPETLVTGDDKVIPWTAFLIDYTDPSKQKTIFPGILVSLNLVFLQAHYFYNDKLQLLQISRSEFQYEVIVGSNEFSNKTNQGQRIPVSFISIHPKFSRMKQWTDTTFDFALAHLSSPVQTSKRVQEVCIPSVNNKNEMEDLIDFKPLFVFGWPKLQDLLYKGIQLKTLNRTECTEVCKQKLTPGHRDNIYCANITQGNEQGLCPNRDIGSFYWSNGTYYFSGQVFNFFSHNRSCTEGTSYLIWSLDNETLQWILNNDKCGSNKFTCFKEGSCIDKSKLCDGIVDCVDASDEQTQYCTNHGSCAEGDFQCKVYGLCVPKTKINDNIPNCPNAEDETNLNKKASNLQLFLWISIGVIITGIGIAGYLYFHFKVLRLKTQIRNLTQAEVDEFREGIRTLETGDTSRVSSSRTVEEYCQLYVNRKILNNPWREEHEIPMTRVELGKELNRGNFGVVCKGRLQLTSFHTSQQKYSDVAVKTYVSNVSVEEFKNLLQEVKILAHVGTHKHIVSFLGACTGDIRRLYIRECGFVTGKLYLLLELCEFGDLLNYLKSHIQQYVENVEGIFVECTEQSTSSSISSKQILDWCCQIANGMDFLETKNVIHGDLASRNILLNTTFDAKISDFGLARELDNSDIYVKSPREILPWRWLALESFTARVYSHKTDVWAYGVTLWEIFSNGQTPYGNTNFNSDFVMNLQNGIRLFCPAFASPKVYDVLMKTWSESPDSRPTFKDLESTFIEIRNNLS